MEKWLSKTEGNVFSVVSVILFVFLLYGFNSIVLALIFELIMIGVIIFTYVLFRDKVIGSNKEGRDR